MAYAQQYESFGLSKAVVDKYTPPTWSDMSGAKAVELIELSSSSREYGDVLSKIKATMPAISVTKIQRVQNPYLWGAYLLKKAEKATLQERNLFHATAQFNINSIVSNNYDWRRTVRSKFGKGVSFSPSAAYADKYCNMMAGTERAMIVNRVLVGISLSGSHNTVVPTPGYDTTTGNGGQVYVKYNDNDFYPEYVAYYYKSHSYGGYRSQASGRSYCGSSWHSYDYNIDYDDFDKYDPLDFDYDDLETYDSLDYDV